MYKSSAETLCRKQVLEKVSAVYSPRIGALARDDGKVVAVRDGVPIASDHAAIFIHEVSNGFLANEYVVYDCNSVFYGSSLLAHSVWESARQKGKQKFLSIAQSEKKRVSEEYQDQAIFVAHNEGGGTWGHYLAQNLPKMLLARATYPSLKLGLPASYISHKSSSWFQLLNIAGISESDVIPLDRNTTYSFKRIFFSDFLWDFGSASPHPIVIQLLKEITSNRQYSGKNGPLGCRKIFIERDPKYGRNIQNIEQIKELCRGFGIEIHKTAALSVGEQIDLFRSANLVIGTLGSDLTNIVFCDPDTHILSLSPEFHGDDFFYNISAAFKLIWSEILCTRKELPSSEERSFYVDPKIFSETIRNTLKSK
jgi:hypothetical protein